jgi:hypothetical protein
MMAGIYGFGGGYSESARRKAAGLNDDGSFMPGYSATQGGIADPRGNLVNSRDTFTAGYKQKPLNSIPNIGVGGPLPTGGTQPAFIRPEPEWLQTGGGQPAFANAKPTPLPRPVSMGEWLKNSGAQQQAPGLGMVSAQGPRVQAGQGLASPQSGFAYTLADLLRNYYA